MLILGMATFLVGALLSAGAAVLPSPVWASGALIAFVVYSLVLLKRSPATFLMLAPLIALRITEFLSGAAIESGSYMTETMFRGIPTGAFAHLLLVYVLFFTSAAMVIELVWPKLARELVNAPERWNVSAPIAWRVMLVIFAIASVYLIRLGLNNGFPLFDHIDRFQYLRKLDSPYYRMWMVNRIIFAPFLGMFFAIPRYRLGSLALLFWMIASSVLFGEKFTSLLMIISMFVMPLGLIHTARGGKIDLSVLGLVVGVVAMITLPAGLLAYGAKSDPSAAVQRYGDRIALQGQLWFQADRKFLKPVAWDPQAISDDAASWIDVTAQDPTLVGTKFGLYYVMELFTPSHELNLDVDAGGGYVFAFYPYLMMVSGILGMLVVSSLFAIYHAMVVYLMMLAMCRSKWLAGLAFARDTGLLYAAYSSGYLYDVMGIKNLATLMLGLVLLTIRKRALPQSPVLPRGPGRRHQLEPQSKLRRR